MLGGGAGLLSCLLGTGPLPLPSSHSPSFCLRPSPRADEGKGPPEAHPAPGRQPGTENAPGPGAALPGGPPHPCRGISDAGAFPAAPSHLPSASHTPRLRHGRACLAAECFCSLCPLPPSGHAEGTPGAASEALLAREGEGQAHQGRSQDRMRPPPPPRPPLWQQQQRPSAGTLQGVEDTGSRNHVAQSCKGPSSPASRQHRDTLHYSRQVPVLEHFQGRGGSLPCTPSIPLKAISVSTKFFLNLRPICYPRNLP